MSLAPSPIDSPIGLNSYSFHGLFREAVEKAEPDLMNLEKFLDIAAGWGIHRVQIDPTHLEIAPEGLQALKTHLDARQMTASLGCSISLIAEDEEVPEILAEYEQYFLACQTLGARVLRCLTGILPYNDFFPIEEQLPLVQANIKALIPHAQKAGVILAFENHGDLTSDQLLEVIETINSPWVKINLDNGNPLFTFEDPVQAFERLAPHAVAIHLKDYKRKITGHGMEIVGCPLGEGIIDLPLQLHAHERLCPTVPLYLEVCLPGGDEILATERSIDYVRKQYGPLL